MSSSSSSFFGGGDGGLPNVVNVGANAPDAEID